MHDFILRRLHPYGFRVGQNLKINYGYITKIYLANIFYKLTVVC